MSCVNSVDKCVTQGDSWQMDVTVTETGSIVDGLPTDAKNLTGATITFSLKDTITGAAVITPSQNLTDLATGRITFMLTPAQTETLIVTPGDGSRILTGEVKITYADSSVDTLFRLVLTVHESWN